MQISILNWFRLIFQRSDIATTTAISSHRSDNEIVSWTKWQSAECITTKIRDINHNRTISCTTSSRRQYTNSITRASFQITNTETSSERNANGNHTTIGGFYWKKCFRCEKQFECHFLGVSTRYGMWSSFNKCIITIIVITVSDQSIGLTV